MTVTRVATVETEILDDLANPQLLVHVTDDDGVVGTGETWWGQYRPDLAPGAPVAPIASMIDAVLAPTCIGQSVEDLGDVEAVWHRLVRATYQYGHEGIVSTAVSGIDIALWDLLAKRRGVPVASLLGPIVHETVPVYASLHWLNDVEAIAADADRALAAGFAAIKLHESRADVILAVSDHLGPDVPLMVDASAAYDEAGAHELAAAVASANLAWLEEPVYPQRDHAALARVRAKAAMPIAAGENEFSQAGFKNLIDSGAVDIVQPEVAKFGGLTPAKSVGKLIGTAGLHCAPHNFSMGPSWLANWHWACTEPSTAWLEIPWLPDSSFPYEMIVPPIVNGTVAAPNAPGLQARDTMGG